MLADLKPIPVGQEPPPMDRGGPILTARDQEDAKKPKKKGSRRTTRDRFGVINAFLDFSAGRLSRAEVLTWLLLWRDTKPDGTAQTSQADLARRIGVDVRTVKRAVTRLKSRGLLAVVHRGSLRRGPSAYRVRPLIPDGVTPASSPPER